MRGNTRKAGGFSGNLVKLGGSKRKLRMKSDVKPESMVHPSIKKGGKQAHKRA
jgi:hypothetical protein